MKNSLTEKIESAVKGNLSDGDYEINGLDGELIPYDKSRARFYLLCSVVVDRQKYGSTRIADFSLCILNEICEITFPEEVQGVEIVLYFEVQDWRRTEKVLRISVVESGKLNIQNLERKHLFEEQPFEGISCAWYDDELGAKPIIG